MPVHPDGTAHLVDGLVRRGRFLSRVEQGTLRAVPAEDEVAKRGRERGSRAMGG